MNCPVLVRFMIGHGERDAGSSCPLGTRQFRGCRVGANAVRYRLCRRPMIDDPANVATHGLDAVMGHAGR